MLEITVGQWPFFNLFQHLADQNPFWSATFPVQFQWGQQSVTYKISYLQKMVDRFLILISSMQPPIYISIWLWCVALFGMWYAAYRTMLRMYLIITIITEIPSGVGHLQVNYISVYDILRIYLWIFITYHHFTSCHDMYQYTDISCQYYELGISLWYLTRICTYVHTHHGFLFTALYFGVMILRSLKCLPENLTYRFCMLWAIKSDLLFLNWKP